LQELVVAFIGVMQMGSFSELWDNCPPPEIFKHMFSI